MPPTATPSPPNQRGRARGIAPLRSYLYLAATTLIISQHNWPLTYAAMAYGAVVAALQIRSARRRTATA